MMIISEYGTLCDKIERTIEGHVLICTVEVMLSHKQYKIVMKLHGAAVECEILNSAVTNDFCLVTLL